MKMRKVDFIAWQMEDHRTADLTAVRIFIIVHKSHRHCVLSWLTFLVIEVLSQLPH